MSIINRKSYISWLLFLLCAFISGATLGLLIVQIESPEHLKTLNQFKPAIPSTIYDIKNRKVAYLFRHQRELVKLEDVPKHVQQAFLIIEDQRFYQHFGIDFIGITRAMITNILTGSIVQGGSTITQQLMKRLFTTGERSLQRKILETAFALQVERYFSKNEILEMYFNQIFLGHGCYGIASAAKFYFNKPIAELNFIEGTILASLPKSPHTYSPFKKPQNAKKKNWIILKQIISKGYLKKHEVKYIYDTFWKSYWPTIMQTPSTKTSFSYQDLKAPYFVETVRQELINLFGEELLYSGGLKIFTTLNLDHQKIAGKETQSSLKKLDKKLKYENEQNNNTLDPTLEALYNLFTNFLPLNKIEKQTSIEKKFRESFRENFTNTFDIVSLSFPSGSLNRISQEFLEQKNNFSTELKAETAFMSLEHKTGRITSMVGGRKFNAANQFNRALAAKRQPGSAFKPFVYGAAFEQRVGHTEKNFIDAPLLNLDQDGSLWAPRNYKEKFRGHVSLRRAFALSLNTISIQLFEELKAEPVIDFANKLMKLPPNRLLNNPSLALGTSEVTPYELLQGIAIIANQGKDVIPHFLIYVTDPNGEEIYNQELLILEHINFKKETDTLQVIEENVAYLMSKLMEGVIDFGTGHNIIRKYGEFRGAAAGKTGTTSSWNDAWFVGFTPDIVAISWSGMDNGNLTLGKGQSGGTIGGKVWVNFIKQYYDLILKEGEKPPQYFNIKKPKSVYHFNVCKENGKLPNEECSTPCTAKRSMAATPITKDDITYRVKENIWNCVQNQKSKSFSELLQEQKNISNEELTKE